MDHIIFLIQCPDHKGLLAKISSYFYDKGFNILHCQQFSDTIRGQYFMRIKLDMSDLRSSRKALESDFAEFAAEFDLTWEVRYSDYNPKVAVMVSKTSHCLYDLLLRQREGDLHCDIPLIISNHPTLEYVAEQFRIPFHCLPVSPETKPEQEAKVSDLLRQHHIDLTVLARYMQILSPEFIAAHTGRVINIHHAFLPAFQGASPYARAHERGVKMIGATAHYATADLDQGPIIEQDVARVTHEDTPEDLKRIGKDVESTVLSRAVKDHLENRIIISGNRTVVFSSGI